MSPSSAASVLKASCLCFYVHVVLYLYENMFLYFVYFLCQCTRGSWRQQERQRVCECMRVWTWSSSVVVVPALAHLHAMRIFVARRNIVVIEHFLSIYSYLFENESAASAIRSAGRSRKEATRVSYPSL